MGVIEKIGRFLDPIVAVRDDGQYCTPNGNHRLQALKKLGVKTVIALLVPDPAGRVQDPRAQHREGAQPAREVARDDPHGARAGRQRASDAEEQRSRFEFEQPAFLTLGVCYEERPRLSGGAYQSILRRVDEFLDEPMNKALKERERRGKKILKLDDAVSAAVEKLKAKGLTSPYLKPFVVARVNYTRFSKATSFDFDETLDKIIAQRAEVQRRARSSRRTSPRPAAGRRPTRTSYISLPTGPRSRLSSSGEMSNCRARSAIVSCRRISARPTDSVSSSLSVPASMRRMA